MRECKQRTEKALVRSKGRNIGKRCEKKRKGSKERRGGRAFCELAGWRVAGRAGCDAQGAIEEDIFRKDKKKKCLEKEGGEGRNGGGPGFRIEINVSCRFLKGNQEEREG